MRITEQIAKLEEFAGLKQIIRAGDLPCSVFGVPDCMKPHLAKTLSEVFARPVILVCVSDEKAQYYSQLISASAYIPKRPLQLRSSVARSRDAMFARIDSLSRLICGAAKTAFLSAESFRARLVAKEDFEEAHITIRKDGVYDPEELIGRLVLSGYERVGAVETAGQTARRGEILDVFCPGDGAPYRIEFFDDTVESISEFDPLTQRRSKKKLEEIKIKPAVELVLSKEAARAGAEYFETAKTPGPALSLKFSEYASNLRKARFFEDMENYAYAFCSSSILDYLPRAIVIFDEYKYLSEEDKKTSDAFLKRLDPMLESREAAEDQRSLYLSLTDLTAQAKKHILLDFCTVDKSPALGAVSETCFNARAAVPFNRKIELLKEEIRSRLKNGWRICLFCGGIRNAEKLSSELSDGGIFAPCVREGREPMPGEAVTYPESLKSGFELVSKKLCFFGENEIYGRAKKKIRPARRSGTDFFSDLKSGDIIVHEAHGKGRFLGLTTREVMGISRDYMEIEYRDGDRLFIPTDQIDRVQKYLGGEGERLSKLGGKEWSAAKERVKKSVKALAEDLLSIYSERARRKGHKYGADTVWQKQFEENFPYEETEGQLKSIEEVKKDMQSDSIMDRLLLGDVGYGKTEVAMRACFKAVMEGRQCAVLVPTTLLARQHYHTFLGRFSDFGVKTEMISRFVSDAEQDRILRGLKDGTVDIVIGTHRLLSGDVEYKDLGLLIIDEEQRFGVSHKERIKDLKRTVDVLTLSATPIPRTLQMSLTGIRDMSVIDTPPEERKPPESYVLEYSGQLLKEAITKEMERGGQTYFVCRRIGVMDKLLADLKTYVPEARVASAHGQMDEKALENVMVGFVGGEYDVLLCTTIIESGIDIPSVNTIIIYEADKFGLAQLYQLKGRVGRASANSYAYLTFIPGTHMTAEARKRLRTIAEFTELGAGFKIAMRDLEIRGAGNLLGPEQSGQMAAVGYDMYCRLMREAVAEIRGQRSEYKSDTSVEININAYIPSEFIADEGQRIEIYKKIAAVEDLAGAKQIREEIADRYGHVLKPVENLILISLIKSFASKAGIVSVTRNGRGFILKYGAETRLNVKRLLEVLKRYENEAQLRFADPPFIAFNPAGRTADLLKFLRDISRCIIRRHKV